MTGLRTGILVGALTVAYAVFAHYASAMADLGAWVLLFAGAPILLVGFGLARDSRSGIAALLFAVAALAVLAWQWSSLDNPVSWLYFLQHIGVNIVLAFFFGSSLFHQRRPLCTVLASTVHPEMTPELLRYTRQVTAAWTLFFVLSAAVSAGLFFLAPIAVWSIYANLLMLPLVGAMFVLESLIRKRVLPKRDQLGLNATVRAFRRAFQR